MKKTISFLYWHTLRKPLHWVSCISRKAIYLIEKEYLGYCRNECKNCYKWRCCVRDPGETPFKKCRR